MEDTLVISGSDNGAIMAARSWHCTAVCQRKRTVGNFRVAVHAAKGFPSLSHPDRRADALTCDYSSCTLYAEDV